MDVFGPLMVGNIFCKVDGTLIMALESEFLLPNFQLSHELLHTYYFIAGFSCGHILGFRG